MTDIQKQAYEDYVKGMKYAGIAAKYDVTIDTVKSWYKRHWKAKKCAPLNDKKCARKNRKSVQPKNKPKGAPKNNQNAVGNSGGAPEGNQNNLRHGAYCKVFDDVLDDDEKILFEDMEDDPEKTYIKELKLYTIRERRILQRIKKLCDGDENLVMERTRSRKLEIKSKNPMLEQSRTEAIADKVSKSEPLNKLEEALTKVQAGIIKCAAELAKLRDKSGNSSDIEKIIINFKR